VEGLNANVVVPIMAAVKVDNAAEAQTVQGQARTAVVVQTVEVEAHIGDIGMTTVAEKDKAGSDGKKMTAKIASEI